MRRHFCLDMKIQVNKQEKITEATTVEALVQELGLPDRGVAVAIANRMVPRSEWAARMLAENDEVTIIKAAFGG